MDVVLVPGGNHGGWWYEPVVDALAAAGHRGHAVTLDGLDPADPEPDRAITLSTHVDELVDVFSAIDGPVVLLGHSYGGHVITGAADAMPYAVDALVYVDAFVPEDGESVWQLTLDWEREWLIDGSRRTGLYVDPLPFFDDRANAHPLATYLQAPRLTGAWKDVPVKHYVLATDPEWAARSPFPPTAERLRDDDAWTVHDLPVTHDVLRTGPDALMGVFTEVLA